MNETRMLALRTMRELLDNDGPDDWDELVACYRALRKAVPKNNARARGAIFAFVITCDDERSLFPRAGLDASASAQAS
jgi:hypothetical protein